MATLDELERLPGGSRGQRQGAGNLPAAMRDLQAKALKSGREQVVRFDQLGKRNAGPTASYIRSGKVKGLLGFNADWRRDGDQQVLYLSYTGRWHGRGDPPDGLEVGPFGYPPPGYKPHKVEDDAGVAD